MTGDWSSTLQLLAVIEILTPSVLTSTFFLKDLLD